MSHTFHCNPTVHPSISKARHNTNPRGENNVEKGSCLGYGMREKQVQCQDLESYRWFCLQANTQPIQTLKDKDTEAKEFKQGTLIKLQRTVTRKN